MFSKFNHSSYNQNLEKQLSIAKRKSQFKERRFRSKEDIEKTISDCNMIKVNLEPNKKQSGIKDNESILCPTPTD